MTFSDDVWKGRLAETMCLARACIESREDQYIMCRQHWAMVPKVLQEPCIVAMGRWRRTEHVRALRELRRAVNACIVAVDAEEGIRARATRR